MALISVDSKDQVKLVPCKEFMGSEKADNLPPLSMQLHMDLCQVLKNPVNYILLIHQHVQLLFLWVLLDGYFQQLVIHIGQPWGTNEILHVYVDIEVFSNF